VSQQINLFNPIFLKQKKHFSAVTMVQSLGVVLFACALLVVYANLQLKERDGQAAASANQLLKAREQLITLATQFAPRQTNAALDDDIKKAQADVDSLQQVFDAMQGGALGNVKGYANYFRAFARQIVDGLWLTGIAIDSGGRDISLQGRTLNPELVPAYLSRLKSEPDIQGKSFSSLSMQLPKAPAIGDPDGKASGNAKAPGPPAYIEFSLHSVDGDGTAAAEAKAK